MTSAGLTGLPQELLDAIVLKLPLDSTLSLTLASPALQPAGEKRLFRHLNLTSFGYATEGSISTVHQQEGSAQDSAHPIETLLRRLQKHPWRSSSVRQIDLDLRGSNPSSLRTVLKLVSCGLEVLNLHSAIDSGMVISPSPEALTLASLLDWPESTFPTLASVRFDIATDWATTISRLLNVAPNLRELRVHATSILPDPQTHDPVPIPVRTKLERLLVDGLHLPRPAQLEALITASPDLQSVTLRDRRLKDIRPSEWTVVSALAKLPNLKSLTIPSYLQDRVSRAGGFRGVEEMQVVWDYATLRERADERRIMPRVAGLKRYQAEIIAYSPHWIYQNFPQPYQHSSAALMSIAFSLEVEIHELPTLEMITLARQPTTALSEPADGYEWRRQDFQGILVHRFESQAEAGKNPDKLVVVGTRAQVGIMGHDRLPIYSGEEMAFYNESQLPLHVLCATLAVGEVELRGLAPGLAELGEKGWAVLRWWEGRRLMECSAGDA